MKGMVEINGRQLRLTMTDENGGVFDWLEISKGT